MKIIFDYDRTLYNPDAGNVFPGVFKLLKTLTAKHDLFLVTVNSQARKDAALIEDLREYFTEVFFVERKSATLFQQIAGEEKNVIVIGDRLEDEINIGMQLGFITIHVQPEKPQYKKSQTPTHRVPEVAKVLPIIQRYMM